MDKITIKNFLADGRKIDPEFLALVKLDVENIRHALESDDILFAKLQCKILKEFLEV